MISPAPTSDAALCQDMTKLRVLAEQLRSKVAALNRLQGRSSQIDEATKGDRNYGLSK